MSQAKPKGGKSKAKADGPAELTVEEKLTCAQVHDVCVTCKPCTVVPLAQCFTQGKE